jgi:Tol biopolymer transport system component
MRKLHLTAVTIAALTAVSGTLATSGGAGGETAAAAAQKIVYQSRLRGKYGYGNNEIFVVSAKGGAPTRLTRNKVDTDAAPTWSPDGKRIAFESDRNGDRTVNNDSDLFVMRLDGNGVRQLTFANGFDGDPTWSRANVIAFESERNRKDANIWTVNPDGSNETQLTTAPAFDGDPSWNPNGTRIVFASTRDGKDNKEIYVMDADGSNQTRLTNDPAADFDPSWSPNGKKIVFASLRDGNVEVYQMNPDGSAQERLTNHPALDALPAWSQDGKQIVFVSDRIGKGQRRLYVMDADGSHVKKLTSGAFDMNPDWYRG